MSYYDRAGRPITLEVWVATRPEEMVVRQESVGQLWVSTVWLGLDHSWTPGGRPLIYETMVFGPGSWSELFMDRYSTEEEALAGHARAVALAQARRHGWVKASRDRRRERMKGTVALLAARDAGTLDEMGEMALRLALLGRPRR